MRYLLSKSSAAGRDLDALDPSIRERIEKRLDELRETPKDHRSKNLRGHRDLRTARVGDWRILYVSMAAFTSSLQRRR